VYEDLLAVPVVPGRKVSHLWVVVVVVVLVVVYVYGWVWVGGQISREKHEKIFFFKKNTLGV
jgi:hypothetical protein